MPFTKYRSNFKKTTKQTVFRIIREIVTCLIIFYSSILYLEVCMARRIDSDSMIPFYQQLSEILLSDIERGKLKQGERIPSENELMRLHNVSRITVRNALARLVDLGHLLKIQGKGTFVAAPIREEVPLRKTISFSKICELQGLKPSAKVLSIRYETAPDEVALFLSLPLGSEIIAIRRLRYADTDPVVIEYNAFAPHMTMLFQEDMEQSLYDVLRRYGHEPTNSTNAVSIHMTTQEEAMLLGIEPGQPIIQNLSRVVNEYGKPLHTSNQLVKTSQNTVFTFYV